MYTFVSKIEFSNSSIWIPFWSVCKSWFSLMKVILKTLRYLNIPSIVIYPCSDPGYLGIIKSIKKFANSDNFKVAAISIAAIKCPQHIMD